MDAGGVRWAKDLGSDDYNLDGYWTMGVGGKRWTYYRLGSLSHNVPVLGNKNQYELDKTYRDLAYLIIRTYRDEKFIKKINKNR